MRYLLFLLAITASAQPVLRTESKGGLTRAILLHAQTSEPVTDESPATPGETLIAFADNLTSEAEIILNDATLAATTNGDQIQFTVPKNISGSFVELSILDNAGLRSNVATTTIAGTPDPSQLLAADVAGLVQRAAASIDDARMAIVVVDRAGRPLAVYRKPQASNDAVETALSLARTGAFFSHNQAPLSSRTIRTISRENFPEVPNQPAAALFGIENTNRGCGFNATFLPGKDVPPARNLSNDGPSKGVITVPGGIPLFKSGLMVGGIGVAGIDPDAAEFSTVAATAGTPFFVPLPLPQPGAVFIDGIRLPYVQQTTQPAGTQPAANPTGTFVIAPRDGAAVPDGYLIGPRAGTALTQADVEGIIQRTVDRANRTRAVIRLPLGSRSKMAISVTDTDGTVLALFRMPDSTVFSMDVAVAKARNVVWFSGPTRSQSDLPELPMNAAVTNRSIGFGAQSMFPSGITGSGPGPFRQLYLNDLANPCTQGSQPKNANQNGIVFFPGSAPLYRGNTIVGGLGVSGDGVEQDDWVTAAGAQGFDAPLSLRSDEYFIRGVRIPYWKFPRNPEQ
ncbi:MAG: heme-binding protein [Acidobacteria bacterium]|nr:heme-binding protein [Acidobacteriota bacterium]